MTLSKRKFGAVCVFIFGLVVLAIFGVILALYFYPNQFGPFLASQYLGRSVTFSNIEFSRMDSLHIEVDDLHIGNRPWGSAPDMFSAEKIVSDVDMTSLRRGRIKLKNLSLEGTHLLLERNKEGVGNWKSDYNFSGPKSSPEEEARRSRISLPAILGLQIKDSDIKFITSSKAVLAIKFSDLNLQTGSEADPIQLNVEGSYNKLPVRLKIETQSFEDLRRTDQPFKMDGMASGEGLKLHLAIESMDPLNFDQFEGAMQLETENLGRSAAYLGGAFNAKWPLMFESTIKHNDNFWELSVLNGVINGNKFHDSRASLKEGARFKADAIKTDIAFERIDIDSLLEQKDQSAGGEKASDPMAWTDMGRNPSTLVEAKIRAQKVNFKSTILSNLNVLGEISENSAGIKDFSFAAMEGSASGSFTSEIKDNTPNLAAILKLQKISAAQLLHAFKIDSPILAGELNLDIRAEGKGSTLTALESSTDGEVHLTLKNGQVARWADDLVASDIAGFFDKKTSMVPVEEMLANIRFKNGFGVLSPFIFKTEKGTLLGKGGIELPQNSLSLLFYTDPSTTSKLALDIPFEISGPFSNVKTKLHPLDKK